MLNRKLLAAAAALAITVAPAASVFANETGVKCMGLNSCKGQGACKTAMNACKAQNDCKGKGVTEMKTDKECVEKGGVVSK